MNIFLIVLVLVALSFLALGVGVWIKGKFPDTHVGQNAEMQKLGIHCAHDDSDLCRGRKSSTCEGCALFK